MSLWLDPLEQERQERLFHDFLRQWRDALSADDAPRALGSVCRQARAHGMNPFAQAFFCSRSGQGFMTPLQAALQDGFCSAALELWRQPAGPIEMERAGEALSSFLLEATDAAPDERGRPRPQGFPEPFLSPEALLLACRMEVDSAPFRKELREALEAWSEHVAQSLSDDPSAQREAALELARKPSSLGPVGLALVSAFQERESAPFLALQASESLTRPRSRPL